MSRLLVDEEELYLPGGVGFIDATDVLERGTKDMEIGTIVSVEGFTLSDAMSALEIMDPRMDTGMADPPPPFDPRTPLLPCEVCWIIDRSFACEMSWHAGLALSQTVYTLQYVHHLADISYSGFRVEPGTRPHHGPEDPERPRELVSLVLRAGVFGLLKCCDLVWRELAHDHLVDGEDWNGEKFGVSLCEGVQPEVLMGLLDEAITWLRTSSSISSSSWRVALIDRLSMRKNIFQSLSYPSFPALRSAQLNLEAILAGSPPPEPPAAVQDVFDPAIARRLVSFVPTRVVDFPPQAEVWESIGIWLERWQETRRLIGADDLLSVKMLASLRAYEEPSPRRSAFLRSLSISTFFNGSKILLSHEPPWLIDHFFGEMAAVEPGLLPRLFDQLSEDVDDASSLPQVVYIPPADQGPSSRPDEDQSQIVELFEKALAKLLVDHFASYYHNRARQRRRLVDSLLDWHLTLEHASKIVTGLSSAPLSDPALARIPLCIRHTRLSVITEVIFSGFELELYTRDEWVTMYWYANQVLSTQVAILDELEASLSRETDKADVHKALVYVSVNREFAEALRCFSSAMQNILVRYVPTKGHINASREQANFERRFKWAFIEGYSEATSQDEDRPILSRWRRWRDEYMTHLKDGALNAITKNLVRARDAFSRLSERDATQTSAVFCQEAYENSMLCLMGACNANLRFLEAQPEILETSRPEWVLKSSRWFPEAAVDPQ